MRSLPGTLDGSPTHGQAAICQARRMGRPLTWRGKNTLSPGREREVPENRRVYVGGGEQANGGGPRFSAPILGHPVSSPPCPLRESREPGSPRPSGKKITGGTAEAWGCRAACLWLPQALRPALRGSLRRRARPAGFTLPSVPPCGVHSAVWSALRGSLCRQAHPAGFTLPSGPVCGGRLTSQGHEDRHGQSDLQPPAVCRAVGTVAPTPRQVSGPASGPPIIPSVWGARGAAGSSGGVPSAGRPCGQEGLPLRGAAVGSGKVREVRGWKLSCLSFPACQIRWGALGGIWGSLNTVTVDSLRPRPFWGRGRRGPQLPPGSQRGPCPPSAELPVGGPEVPLASQSAPKPPVIIAI